MAEASDSSSEVINPYEHEPEFVQDMNDFAAGPRPRLLLLVSGRPLASEVLEICTRLAAARAEVKVVCTSDAVMFVNRPLLSRLFDVYCDADFPQPPGHGLFFQDLIDWATALVIAPMSGHYLAKVALGLSDDLFCQIANSWPYLDVFNINMPGFPLEQAAKPACVFVDMDYMPFITSPTWSYLQELMLRGAIVFPGRVLNAQHVFLSLTNHLGIPN